MPNFAKYRRLLPLLLLLWGSLLPWLGVQAQDQHTPASAAYKHASNLVPGNYRPEKAGEVLLGADPEQAPVLAEQLKKIMDAYGISVDTNLLSHDPFFEDTVTHRNVYYPFPEFKDIYLQKSGNNWYYSSQTVERIPKLYAEVFPKGSDTIAHYLRKLGNGRLLGLEQWQWLGFAIILLGSVLVYYITYFLVRKIARAITKRRIVHSNESARTIRVFSRIFSLLVAVRIIRALYPLLLLPLSVNATILMTASVVQIVFLGFMFYKAADVFGLIGAKLAANTASTLDDQLVPLAKKLGKAFIIITTLLLVLGQVGVNLTALLAGLSIGGLALAFAAQDSVKNIFGSLMLLLDRSFQIGDQVLIPSIDNIEGVIEEVGLRSTRIRTFDNSLISIPNGKLADAAINNLGLRVLRRFKFNLSISYETPPELIEHFVYGVRELMQVEPMIKADTINAHLYAFDSSALIVRCSCYFQTQDFAVELNTRQQLILDILRLAETIGVEFAYPTTTMYVQGLPGQTPPAPKAGPVNAENIQKIDRLIEQIRIERNTQHPGENMD